MSRFTTVIAKFLQISLAFFRAVLQTMAPLPAKQANLEKKNRIIIFFKETETDHFKWAISYETNGQKKKTFRNTTN